GATARRGRPAAAGDTPPSRLRRTGAPATGEGVSVARNRGPASSSFPLGGILGPVAPRWASPAGPHGGGRRLRPSYTTSPSSAIRFGGTPASRSTAVAFGSTGDGAPLPPCGRFGVCSGHELPPPRPHWV